MIYLIEAIFNFIDFIFKNKQKKEDALTKKKEELLNDVQKAKDDKSASRMHAVILRVRQAFKRN